MFSAAVAVDLALRDIRRQDGRAHAQEVLDVGHTEGGLGADLRAAQVIGHIQRIHKVHRLDGGVLEEHLHLTPDLRHGGLETHAVGCAGAGGQELDKVTPDALLDVFEHFGVGVVHRLAIALSEIASAVVTLRHFFRVASPMGV